MLKMASGLLERNYSRLDRTRLLRVAGCPRIEFLLLEGIDWLVCVLADSGCSGLESGLSGNVKIP